MKTPEVLFVDDQLEEIKPVADTLELRTGLETACADTIEQTLEIIRAGHIKVAVLDQRMEERLEVTGIELFEIIRAQDRRVRGIIFSAQSGKADLIQVVNASELRYLDKGCKPEVLAREVLRQRANYYLDIEREHDRSAIAIGRYRKSRFARASQLIELLAVEDLPESPLIPEGDYFTVLEIGAGRTRRIVDVQAIENYVQVTRESMVELQAQVGLGLAQANKLSSRLRDSLREQSQSVRYSRAESTLEEQVALSDADNQAGVIHRRIDMAPLYRGRRVLLRVSCDCCGGRRIFSVNVKSWSGRYHRRQIDTYRDATRVTYDLGPA